MATADSVKAKLRGLIYKANETTGDTNTDLTSALNTLCEGYGKGGENSLTRVPTASQMNTILANATEDDVGKGYLYVGETTDDYENGVIYVISSVGTDSEEIEKYTGEYLVTPTGEDQTLPTANKHLLEDVVVQQIPFAEVSNTSGGTTVTIG